MARPPKRRTVEECPYRAEHTPSPSGYMAWHSWAHRMAQSHRQIRCKACGLYVIWVARGTNKRMLDPVVPERSCLTWAPAAADDAATGGE